MTEPWRVELAGSDVDCPYHSRWPCGFCDDCVDWMRHPAEVVPLCPGWSKCTCMRGTAGHSVAAQLEGLNDG